MPRMIDRKRTQVWLGGHWTLDKMRSLRPPWRNSRYFFLYRASDTKSGLARTEWFDNGTDTPDAAWAKTGISPAVLLQVVFDKTA